MERSLETCKSYIQAQCEQPRHAPWERRPFITISRQAGAGGITIGEKLAKILSREDISSGVPWTVFDKNLVEAVIQYHHLPPRFAAFMREDAASEIKAIMDELFGGHPPELKLVHDTTATILYLAKAGSAIIVGRGANIVTRDFGAGFHVRLVGSLEKRLAHFQSYYRLSTVEAAKSIKDEDEGRRHYVKAYFNKNINDPLLYDLIINTDHISFDEAAEIIANAVLTRKARVQKV